MVRTLGVHCAAILAGTMDNEMNAEEISTDEEVMRMEQALCEFCLVVSHRSHSDLFLTALNDALK
jgi:hypothetical protein